MRQTSSADQLPEFLGGKATNFASLVAMIAPIPMPWGPLPTSGNMRDTSFVIHKDHFVCRSLEYNFLSTS